MFWPADGHRDTEVNNHLSLYLVGSEEQPLQVVVICMDVVPDDWRPLQDRGHLLYRLHRDFVGHHFWTYTARTGKDGMKLAPLHPLFVNTCVPILRFLTSPQNVDPGQQLLSHRVKVCGLGHSGGAKRRAVI